MRKLSIPFAASFALALMAVPAAVQASSGTETSTGTTRSDNDSDVPWGLLGLLGLAGFLGRKRDNNLHADARRT